MLLGKRPRPPIKRTTSLSEITFDLGDSAPASSQQYPDHHHQNGPLSTTTTTKQKQVAMGGGAGSGTEGLDQRFLSTVSPRGNNRRHSADFVESGHFLRSCCLCRRRLVPGRDIYMYRGDSAFCSSDCRQQQMNQDEKKEKCSFASAKKQNASTTTAAGSQVPTKGGTVAAV